MFKLIVMTICMLGIITPSSSQNNGLYEFESRFRGVLNTDSLTRIEKSIDSIERTFFGKNSQVFVDLDTSSNWRFLYAVSSGWDHVVGHETLSYRGTYIGDSIQDLITGKELWTMFQAINGIYDNDSLSVQPYPAQAITDTIGLSPQAIEWWPRERFVSITTTTSLNNKYLIVRWVHSYPHGNQTSWHHERRYYFKSLDGNSVR